jgi:Tol biopolymer transport system component/predicted Ser/Thr protein kinase
MSIAVGTRLGPYEIIAPAGVGGMGEVYRARDMRLERTVAIKVLPAHLSSNPDRKQRFEREARAVANLSHPHICTLHDIGQQEGVDFLVMEYVEGETLEHRLAKGPLPAEQVLRCATEIAGALDKAHRLGIVHRDLKPSNIMLTQSGTKLLDFGLAKLTEQPVPVAAALSDMVTEGQKLTAEGTLLGTFQYMAPEQLEGHEADARTDIFALGAVVYEMATGRPAFSGKTKASLIASILSSEPKSIVELAPMTPPALDRAVKTCLAKDPDERWQNARDLANELKWIAEGGSQIGVPALAAARRRVRERSWIVATAVLAISTIALGVAYFRARPAWPAPQVRRLAVALPADQRLVLADHPALALSPDGTRVVYVAESSGAVQLYLRSMDRLEALPLAGTEGASSPFFSPDGQWIGFFADGKLNKVSVQGGPPVTLCDAPENRGATWGPDDAIVFTPATTVGLSRVSAAGGPTQVLTTPDTAQGERTYRWPEILPGGKAVVFTIGSLRSPDYYLDAKLAVLSLDTGKVTVLPVAGSNAHYAPSGHLVFASQGGLFVVPFDAKRLEVTGAANSVLEGVMLAIGTGAAHYSLSRTGSLIYVPGKPLGASYPLAWLTRKGTSQPLPAPPRPYQDPHLSPDGKRLAVAVRGGRNQDVWVYEIARNTLTRLTFEGSNRAPLWTPDGKRIAYASERGPNFGIYWKPADGSGPEERLTTSRSFQLPGSWSPDGKLLAFTENDPKNQLDIWILPMEGNRQPRPFLKTPFYEGFPVFSPDGRWLAYASSEAGQSEVYVQAFPGPAGKWQISSGGGEYPRWARNGRELFYYSGNKFMSVTITTQPTFAASSPRPLFEGRPSVPSALVTSLYDVASNGEQFIMASGTGPESESRQVHVVLDWTEELKRQVPSGKN